MPSEPPDSRVASHANDALEHEARGKNEGLSQQERLRKRTDFVRLQGRSGARVRTRSCLLLIDRRSLDGPTRLGVVASKKVGNAVARNRAKRLLREAFRHRKALFGPGLDVVAIAFDAIVGLGLRDVLRDFDRAAHEIGRRVRPLAVRTSAAVTERRGGKE